MTYTPSKPKPKEQRLVCTGMNWQQFKSIQQGFTDYRGIRLFYYKGEVEILAVSPEHETVRETLAVLLGIYFAEKQIECVPTGAFTQEKEGEASAQADISYFIGRRPVQGENLIPDLSIEVVITSGGVNKLNRYSVLGVPEVWFWEDGLFSLYHLRESGYEKIEQSELLADLNIEFLSRCVMMDSFIDAISEFRMSLAQ